MDEFPYRLSGDGDKDLGTLKRIVYDGVAGA
jgi:hypothetical protein